MQKRLYINGAAGSGKTEYIKNTAAQYEGKKLALTFSLNEQTENFKPVSIENLIQR